MSYYYFKLYHITTLVANCRIDSFRLRGTGSMCHMFLLNVEFGNACRFRVFQCQFSTVSRFPFLRFQPPQCWHGRTEYTGSCPHFYQIGYSKCCGKFFVLTMSLYAFISLLYKQLLQYTLLKSVTGTIRFILTNFPKKFHTKRLASDIIFTKLSTKTLLFWRCRVSFEYQGPLQNTPASFLLLFLNVQASL